MINEFKKYDKEHTRLVTISVSDFNELIKETNISIETKRDYDLKSLIAKFLDLKHIDIRWNAFDGNKVDLEYKI